MVPYKLEHDDAWRDPNFSARSDPQFIRGSSRTEKISVEPGIHDAMKFPHYIRFFSALGLIGALFSLNVLLWQKENAQVLGSTTASNMIAKLEAEREQKETLLENWKKISNQYPNYRDAYVWSGSLAYELGRFDEAKTQLLHASSLDQYFEFPKKILATIQ